MRHLTWNELCDLPAGTRVVFPGGWDIYPHCVVPDGTVAIITRADRGTDSDVPRDFPVIEMLPNNAEVREALREWQGCIVFTPGNDGHELTDESPVALQEKENA